jgi:hypothetical protein
VVRRNKEVTAEFITDQIVDRCGGAVQRGDVLVHAVTINYGKNPSTGQAGYPLQAVYFYNPKVSKSRWEKERDTLFQSMFLPRVCVCFAIKIKVSSFLLPSSSSRNYI